MKTAGKVTLDTSDPRAAKVMEKLLRETYERMAMPEARKRAGRIIADARAAAGSLDLQYPFRLLDILEKSAMAAKREAEMAFGAAEEEEIPRPASAGGTLDLTDPAVLARLVTPLGLEAEVAFQVYDILAEAIKELHDEGVGHILESMLGLQA